MRIGDILFIHGAISRESVGFVPLQESIKPFEEIDLNSYINDLNKFKDKEVHLVYPFFLVDNCLIPSSLFQIQDYMMNSAEHLSTLTPSLYWGYQGGYDSLTPGSRLIQVLKVLNFEITSAFIV